MVLDVPALKLDVTAYGRLPNSVATAAVEHPTAASGMSTTAYASVPPRPGATAFLVAHLAMVDGGCMCLDGPALIPTGYRPALAARVATGPQRVDFSICSDFLSSKSVSQLQPSLSIPAHSPHRAY